MEEKQGGAHAVTRYIVDRNASPRADHETARGIPPNTPLETPALAGARFRGRVC